jgi:hypothetical protein
MHLAHPGTARGSTFARDFAEDAPSQLFESLAVDIRSGRFLDLGRFWFGAELNYP